MNIIRFFLVIFLSWPILSFGQKDTRDQQHYSGQSPHLEKQGTATQLIVNGKPFLLIGGELHNSATGGFAYMRPIWKGLAERHLNSVVAPVSWELLEPEEGKFNFSQVDSVIYGARAAHLKVVLIWFASWKNGGSTYIPSWVKKDYTKYPRVKDANGKVLEILSTFGKASAEADAKAFAVLMHHIRQIDNVQQTVVTVQVENEVGVLDNLEQTPGSARRDFSAAADAAFNGPVPRTLISYLIAHKDSLYPELHKVWAANGFKTSGSWEEVFGKGKYMPDQKDFWHSFSYYTEELFMAWNYASYIEKVAAAGKKEYPLPMYVNTWLRYSSCYTPGKFPSGCPLPEVFDIWWAGAPSIDILAPDAGEWGIKDEFGWVCRQYSRNGNPLFIPESTGTAIGAAKAFYAFGEYNAICYSPFGIDNPDYKNNDILAESYAILENMEPIILQNQGKGTMRGIFVDSASSVQRFDMGDYVIEARLAGWQKLRVAGGIIIQTSKNQFIVAGRGIDIFFMAKDSSMRIGVDSDDEGHFKGEKWVSDRRLNGDEVHSSTWIGTGAHLPDGKENIQKISFYHYK